MNINLGQLAMPLPPFAFSVADLAPGDGKSAHLGIETLDVRRIQSTEDAEFEQVYGRLWEQFGQSGEMESRFIIDQRLTRSPYVPSDGFAMRYDLLGVFAGGRFAAARDHTAIADARGAVVHLSHALVDPTWRRTGLAGWLRAFPIQTARACLRESGFALETPIALVAEMEFLDDRDESRQIRLKAYERAGYRKIDPGVISYLQPDFRSPEAIDASGGAIPLPFQLIIRRVGREAETEISGKEVRSLVERLYAMYARDFRSNDMAIVWRQLESYPDPEARIALLLPTA